MYVVMREMRVSDEGKVWQEVGESEAASGEAAIAEVAQKSETGGTYLAVPGRSYHPMGLTLQQQTKLVWEDGNQEPEAEPTSPSASPTTVDPNAVGP
jgi:hypothetical protein